MHPNWWQLNKKAFSVMAFTWHLLGFKPGLILPSLSIGAQQSPASLRTWRAATQCPGTPESHAFAVLPLFVSEDEAIYNFKSEQLLQISLMFSFMRILRAEGCFACEVVIFLTDSANGASKFVGASKYLWY